MIRRLAFWSAIVAYALLLAVVLIAPLGYPNYSPVRQYIAELGAKVAIDDFGAGYTSFRNLQSLKVDMVKVDGSFVKGLAESRDNQIFVRTLVDLAKNFELATVAEWVSEQREAEILRGFGVDLLQGFYFGKPEVREPWTQ